MSAADDNRSSAEVEGEAEGARAALAHTLDQLRDNLKPAHVIEEVVSNARIGASTVADQLYQMARDHPFPAMLIGLGATMIFGLGAKTMSSMQPLRGLSRNGRRGSGSRLSGCGSATSLPWPAPATAIHPCSRSMKGDVFPWPPRQKAVPTIAALLRRRSRAGCPDCLTSNR